MQRLPDLIFDLINATGDRILRIYDVGAAYWRFRPRECVCYFACTLATLLQMISGTFPRCLTLAWNVAGAALRISFAAPIRGTVPIKIWDIVRLSLWYLHSPSAAQATWRLQPPYLVRPHTSLLFFFSTRFWIRGETVSLVVAGAAQVWLMGRTTMLQCWNGFQGHLKEPRSH